LRSTDGNIKPSERSETENTQTVRTTCDALTAQPSDICQRLVTKLSEECDGDRHMTVTVLCNTVINVMTVLTKTLIKLQTVLRIDVRNVQTPLFKFLSSFIYGKSSWESIPILICSASFFNSKSSLTRAKSELQGEPASSFASKTSISWCRWCRPTRAGALDGSIVETTRHPCLNSCLCLPHPSPSGMLSPH